MKELSITGGGITTLLNNSLLDAGSVVKSVQRGTISYQEIRNNTTYSIPISQVNPQKSIIVGQYHNTYKSDGDWTHYAAVGLNNAGTAIDVKIRSTGNDMLFYFGMSWQVIEFY